MSDAAEQIIAAIGSWRIEEPGLPFVVAIDGHGAAGKTTIATEVAAGLGASVVHTDDYFHDAEDIGDPRPMAQYYSWQALREAALAPMIRSVRDAPDGRTGADLIVVEGVSSAAPALADLIDRSVFVQTPEAVRLARLHARVSDADWDEEWLYAERLYFASRPPDSFDLIVGGED